MLKNKNIIKLAECYQIIAAGIIILWANNGIYELVSLPRLLPYLLFLFFFIFAHLTQKNFIRNVFRKTYLLIPVFIIAAISIFLNQSQESFILFNLARYPFIFISLYEYFKERHQSSKILICIFLADLLLLTARTFYYLSINPMISRLLATETYRDMVPAVGGYDFVYGLPIIIFFLVSNLRKPKSPLAFITTFLLLSALSVCLFMSHYMIADLLLIVGLFVYTLIILCQKYQEKRKLIIVGTCSALLAIIVCFIVFAANTESVFYMIQIRAREILDLATGNGGQGTDLSIRFGKYLESIAAFLKNPLFGDFGAGAVGGHSSWLDLLGSYGLLSIFGLLFIAKSAKRSVDIQAGPDDKQLMKIIWGYYIIFGLINTAIFASFFLKLFLIIPLALELRRHKRFSATNSSATSSKKRILWTTNIIMPYPAKQLHKSPTVFGGWLTSLFQALKNSPDYTFGVASVYRGKELKKYQHGGVTYYLVPSKLDILYQPSQEGYWRAIIDDFQPDLIHLHGTEYAHNLALQNACPDQTYLVTIQGLLKSCAKAYTAGLDKSSVRGEIYITQKLYKVRARYEKAILKNATALTGRTNWDRKEALKIAGDKPYYKCNETLRESFYGQNWHIKDTEPYSIYISQASYPIKGFHVLLDALPELAQKYPTLKVYVAGTQHSRSSYAKLLANKINSHHLGSRITFLGELTEKEVLKHMQKCNVFVQCSSIENSSNSLGEAMLIGMPCVASKVGGTPDLLNDQKDGLLYNFGDTKALISHISKIFSDQKLAVKLGQNAQKHAKITHDKSKNTQEILKIYKDVLHK